MNSARNDQAAWAIPAPAATAETDSVYHVMPTLVIACGGIPELDFDQIRKNVDQRLGVCLYPDAREKLGFAVPQDVVLWERLGSSAEVTSATLEKFVAPFRAPAYEESLVLRKVIPYAPNRQGPLKIQILVLYEDAHDEASKDLLLILQEELSKVFTNPAAFSLVLIALDLPGVDLGNGTLYWPRFCLQAKTPDEVSHSRERILEFCENLVVALVSSELVRRIDGSIRRDSQPVKWIWVGASALVSDVAEMYEYVRLSVLEKLIHPLLTAELTPGGQHWIDQQGYASEIHKALWDRTLSITGGVSQSPDKSPDWDVNPPPEPDKYADLKHWLENLRDRFAALFGLARKSTVIAQKKKAEEEKQTEEKPASLRLMPGNQVKQKLSPLKNVPPKPDFGLAKFLFDRYVSLRDVLERNLFDVVREIYLPHADDPRRNNPSLLYRLSKLTQPPAQVQPQQAVTPLGDQKPGGLAALMYALAAVTFTLRQVPDVELEGIAPHAAKSDYYLATVADADAWSTHAAHRRYWRYKRTLLSPWGFILKLLPAWPLLSAILIHFWHPDELRAALYAGLMLIAFGLVMYVNGKQNVQWLCKVLQDRQERVVARHALGNLARVLRDYRLMILSHLQAVEYTLTNLRTILEQVRPQYLESKVKLKGSFEAYDQVEATEKQSAVYKLARKDNCEGWVDLAKTSARELFSEVIAEEIFSKRRQSFSHVFNRMVDEMEKVIAGVVTPGQLQQLQVAEMLKIKPLLAGGEHWNWLHQHAQPKGGVRAAGGESFTIVTYNGEAVFETRQGEKSMRQDWDKARSLQVYEVGCIRGFVER